MPARCGKSGSTGKATTPAKLEVIDDFTFKLTYAAPFGALPAHLTRWEPGNWPSIIGPSHFYKQFHNKYTDQAKLDEMAAAVELETWVQLFNRYWQWGMAVWQFPTWMQETKYPLSPGCCRMPQEDALSWSAIPTAG
jgi:hypothetical protein